LANRKEGEMAANPNSGNTTTMKWIPYVVSIVVLLVFALFVNYMLGLTKVEETEWTRAVYLFSGVEAIAFAAAGFLFGREVHRVQAEKADKRADEAEKRASEAEKDAINGKALATAIKVKTQTYRSKSPTYATLDKRIIPSISQADFNELKDIATQLFP
jgi:type VI protein secretion system component VasK